MKKILFVTVALLVLVAFVGGVAAQHRKAPAPPPAPYKTEMEMPKAPKAMKASGTIAAYEAGKMITMKGAKDKEWTFDIAPDVKIKGEPKEGAKVTVMYKKDGDKMLATSISVAAAKKPKAPKKEWPIEEEKKLGPPNLTATVKFTEPSGNNILDGDEKGLISLILVNNGSGDAYNVRAEIIPNKILKGLSFPREIFFGKIGAGQGITKAVELIAGEDIPTDELGLDISIKEANGFNPNPLRVSFKTKTFEPPKLVVADMGIDDQNRNGKVEPMEIVEITARIQNIGFGDARNVDVDIMRGQNVFIGGDGITHFRLGSIPAGNFKDIKFMFYTNTQIKNGEVIPISLKIREARPRFQGDYPLLLVMNTPQKRVEEIIVQAIELERKTEIRPAGGLSVDVDIKIPQGKKAGKYDFAVIIGNKNYAASGSPDIEFAHRDASIMKDYLIRSFGYDSDNIIYVEDATSAKFNEIFGSERDFRGRLFNSVKQGVSKVFVFYVGHGAPDIGSHEAYFVPVDANPQYIKASGYRLQTFYDNLARIPAKNIIIVLDACFSGNTERGMLFRNISPAMVRLKSEYSSPQNAILFTSGAVDQVSTWYREKKHSLFSYYFFKGLQGEADVDRNQKITVGEMRNYLKENVPYMARRLIGVEQTPVITGKDDDVLVDFK